MVKIFLDSAILGEIRAVKKIGILEGVTTNPSLIKKSVDKLKKEGKKVDIEGYIKEILRTCGKRPVSLEVIGLSFEEMVREGKLLYKKFGKYGNVYVKIPVNPCIEKKCKMSSDGIRAIVELWKSRIPVNCTLVFTPEQALLAAKAGAKFISPFIGRVDDYIREMNRVKFDKEDYFPKDGFEKSTKILEDNGIVSGVGLVKECVEIFRKNKIKSEVLAASVRSTRQFREAVCVGADIVTLPYKVIIDSLEHGKTIEGMKKFSEDVVEEYARLLRGGKDEFV
jgi:transaldolase